MDGHICTTIEHKIGKITYQVISSTSEKARETIDIKINNIIKKNISESGKPLFSVDNQ